MNSFQNKAAMYTNDDDLSGLFLRESSPEIQISTLTVGYSISVEYPFTHIII